MNTDTDTPETDAHQAQEGMAHDWLWRDFARKLERERDELRSAIRNLRDAKGRFHTEQAATKLFNLLP